jgi:hypothetical protein
LEELREKGEVHGSYVEIVWSGPNEATRAIAGETACGGTCAMVMGGFDVIGASRRFAGLLQELGLAEWSGKLIDAMRGASTGGELVMAVRWLLQELERSGAVLPDDAEQLMRKIVQEIDATGW